MGFFESIGAFFASLPAELYVFLISILPIVELRGAIPIGAALSVPFYINYPLSILGNLLPVPFILLFIPKILDFLMRFKFFRPMVVWLRKKADKHKDKVLGDNTEKEDKNEASDSVDKASNGSAAEEGSSECACASLDSKHAIRPMTRAIFIALIIFVAVPAPGTGAWTGGLIASLFNLPKKWSALAILLGVLISGVVMCLASYGVLGFLSFLT